MPKFQHVNHRNVPRDVAAPKIVREGVYVPIKLETPYVDPATQQNQKQLTAAQAVAASATQDAMVKKAETTALKSLLDAAREESRNLRKRLTEIERVGTMPNIIEIVSIDNITREREGDVAILDALCKIDSNVGSTKIMLPVDQMKVILKQKREGKNAG